MTKALIALHFQNDVCHPNGKIPFAVDRSADDRRHFFDKSRGMIGKARKAGWTIAHVHITFEPDYSDLPRNCRLFLAVESLGAMTRGSWGAAALDGFEPQAEDIIVTHACNNAFQGTKLEAILRERDVKDLAVMGLATQYSVEHTVRHAADLGFNVTMIRDCCGSANKQAAEASFAAMAMLAEVKNSDEIA